MNVSKGLFVVLLMSVVSILMLAAFASAAAPKITMNVPANVIAGTSFKVSVVAMNDTSVVQPLQLINTITLASDLNWPVSPQSVNCNSQLSCVADFIVTAPSTASVGQAVKFTAQVATTTDPGSATATSMVSGAPSAIGKPPVRVDAAEVDGFELSTSETNIRDLERGEEFTLKIKMTANANAKDIEIRAFVSGFEFSSSEPISDSTSPFDVEAGVSYVKSLTLKLPERADEDRYRIRVVVAGRDTDDITMNYRVKVSPTDHEVVIKELSVTPEEVQPGRAVLATVRIKNLGNSREDDVKIRVGIPELGVTAAPDFVDELETDDSATSSEFFLRIDSCAKPGTYDVKAEVTFEEGDKVVTARQPITVVQGGTCQSRPSVSSGDVSVYGSEPQEIEAGESGSYSVTITNRGTATKVYSLSASGVDGWASVKFSPGSMVTVKPGDTQTVVAVVAVDKDAGDGANAFTIRVKDQSGDVVKELSLLANVEGREGPDVGGLVQLLQWGLIALIIVLVIVGLVVAFRRMQGPKEGEEGAQTYY